MVNKTTTTYFKSIFLMRVNKPVIIDSLHNKTGVFTLTILTIC